MERTRKILKVLYWILVANLIVASVKLVLGYIYGINSLTADGFHSLTDSFSNIVGIIGIKIASKPADENHPYGHQKFETIAGLAIGFVLLGIIVKILSSAVDAFINPVEMEVNIATIISLAATVVINVVVARIEYNAGKKLKSEILISDSVHTKSDIFISVGVLVTLVLTKFLGFPKILDPIVSIIIAIFILRAAIEIFKMTIGTLVDENIVDTEEIVNVLKAADKRVLNIHKIRSRGRMDHYYIDLHIMVDPNLSVRDAHALNHKLEEALEAKYEKEVDLVCHIEPYEVDHNDD